MSDINPHACREGFEQQRKAGINVDWFTWQIAWHDAMFTQVDTASQQEVLTPDWLWRELMDYCKKRGVAPSNMDGLFEIVKHARALIATAEQRCRYCDGTGDVHRADGEWLGECTECDARKQP